MTPHFTGGFWVEPALQDAHRAYLQELSRTRRMRRDPQKAEQLFDPVRLAANLPIGHEGAYFVGGTGYAGQDEDDSIIDYDEPPGMPSMYELVDRDTMTDEELFEEMLALGEAEHDAHMSGDAQPSLWCRWTPTDDGKLIIWDGVEKFRNYVEWIEYLLQHFLVPWGYVVNGRADWQGIDEDDVGAIHINDSVVGVW